MSFSRTIINGRLTADPEIKTFSDGTEYCNFTVAVTRGYKDKSGNRPSDFFSCKVTRGGSALLQKYFKKGDGIMLEGAMESRKYEKDGVNHIVWELNVSGINFPDGKKVGEGEIREPVMEELPDDEPLPF